MNWEQRVKDCKRRASVAYPEFLRAKKLYERRNKLWTYWENRSFEAQRKAMEVTKVPPNLGRKGIERHKERMKSLFRALPVEQRQALLAELKGAK